MTNKLPPKPQPNFTVQQLQDYIALTHHLTGLEVKEILVSRDYLIWYKAQVQQVAKNFNIDPASVNVNEPKFMNVKLVEVKK